jgi:hypothetical protein
VPDASWRRLREPSPWPEKLVALPISVVAAVIVAALWLGLTPLRDITHEVSLFGFLLSVAGIIIVHELLHALAHPMAGRSSHSVVGFSPAQAFFYGHYQGEMSRNRFLTILLTPLCIISIVPLLVSGAAQVSSGWVALVSVVNAFCACGDMLLAGLVLFQVPASGRIRQQSWRTYWRERDTLAA